MATSQGWLDFLIIGVYMAAIIGVGFFFSKKNETAEGYLLGDRNMSFIAVGLSCMVSIFSSVSIVTIPGEIYSNGFTMYALMLLIYTPMSIPAYLLFVKFFFKLGSFTPYEYLEYRYDKSVRAIIAITTFYGRTLYLGMVLYSASKIFESIYGWPAWVSILLVGAVGVLYTVTGGLKAVIWTDVIQFFVLVGGMIAIIIVLSLNINGGAIEAVTYAFRHGRGIPQYGQMEFYTITPYARLLFFSLLWGAIIQPLSSACSDQITIQRLLSTKDWKTGFKAQILDVVVRSIACIMLFFIGFAVFTYYHQNPSAEVAKLGGDAALFHFIGTKLPVPLPGIFMAALLAAIMSSLDSGINSMSTIWLKEIHEKFINTDLSPKQEVYISRMSSFMIGAFAIILGMCIDISGQWLRQSLVEVNTVFMIFSSIALPAFFLAVLTKRANAKLIWGYTFFSFGEAVGKNIWYVLSRSSKEAWIKDPSIGFGWAGKLELQYFLVPLLIGTIIFLFSFLPRLRGCIWQKVINFSGIIILGFSFTVGLWYFFSNTLITNAPEACSFAFFLPVSLVGLFGIVWFFPEQPREKYQGLTIKTINEPILTSKS